ncbi:MAG: hypothetical protein A2Z34_04590 [Planctomycetes bacterium RBG_16_59_8]|nr:MAG: hypothetical protein A2Z34_04590 [Planctomycetes bacterium RBG_16_59_8]
MSTPILALLLLASCRTTVEPADFHHTQDILREKRLGPSEAVSIIDVTRSSKNSVHLVQVRGEIAPHYHRDRFELVYILSGSGLFTLRQQGKVEINRMVKAGDIFSIPAGSVHSFHNDGETPTIALSIFTPPFDGKDRHELER